MQVTSRLIARLCASVEVAVMGVAIPADSRAILRVLVLTRLGQDLSLDRHSLALVVEPHLLEEVALLELLGEDLEAAVQLPASSVGNPTISPEIARPRL